MKNLSSVMIALFLIFAINVQAANNDDNIYNKDEKFLAVKVSLYAVFKTHQDFWTKKENKAFMTSNESLFESANKYIEASDNIIVRFFCFLIRWIRINRLFNLISEYLIKQAVEEKSKIQHEIDSNIRKLRLFSVSQIAITTIGPDSYIINNDTITINIARQEYLANALIYKKIRMRNYKSQDSIIEISEKIIKDKKIEDKGRLDQAISNDSLNDIAARLETKELADIYNDCSEAINILIEHSLFDMHLKIIKIMNKMAEKKDYTATRALDQLIIENQKAVEEYVINNSASKEPETRKTLMDKISDIERKLTEIIGQDVVKNNQDIRSIFLQQKALIRNINIDVNDTSMLTSKIAGEALNLANLPEKIVLLS